jgi:hypothetical protein
MGMVEDLREAAAWLQTLTENSPALPWVYENIEGDTSVSSEASADGDSIAEGSCLSEAHQLIVATSGNPTFMKIVIRMMEESANSLIEAVETSGALTQLLGMTGGGVHAPIVKLAQSVLAVKATVVGPAK